MKYILTLMTAIALVSCSSGQITKEEILAKHLKEENTQLDSSREPAQAIPKSHHFRTMLNRQDFMSNFH